MHYTPMSGVHLAKLSSKLYLGSTFFNKCHKCGYEPTKEELEYGTKLIEDAYSTEEGKSLLNAFKHYNVRYLRMYNDFKEQSISPGEFERQERELKEEFKRLTEQQQRFNDNIIYV